MSNKHAPKPVQSDASERIAKRLARVGLCSRREAETWILAGRVKVNGKVLDTPAITVTTADQIEVDGNLLAEKDRTRLWLFHKPSGLVTTNRDPQGRKTIFDIFPENLPRLVTVGRLDINTEGLLLLTNDGGLSRVLELPTTGWLRRYRVRAHGNVTQEKLDELQEGIAVDGVLYGSIEATLDQRQGANSWLTVSLREGKNREVKNVLGHLGLSVNRLIRVSFGPFQLGELASGEIREIKSRTLREQLGQRLIEESGADFSIPIKHLAAASTDIENKGNKPGKGQKPGSQAEKLKRGVAKGGVLDRMSTSQSTKDDRPTYNKSRKTRASRRQSRG